MVSYGCPSFADTLVSFRDRLRQTDHLERVVGTGERVDTLNGVLATPVDQVGGPHLPSELQLAVEQVHRDDALCSGQPRPLNHVQSDTAGADDHDVAARFDLCGVRHCADAGRHGATDHAHDVEWHILPNLHDVVLIDNRALGEDGHLDELCDGLTVL